MLVARDGQHPAANALAVDCFGFPRTVRLLGGCLVLGSHAFIRPTTTITHEITSDDVISRDVSAAHSGAMRPSLDNLIALLLHPPIEVLDQLLVRAEDAGMRHSNSLEDPKHGCQEALVRAGSLGACGFEVGPVCVKCDSWRHCAVETWRRRLFWEKIRAKPRYLEAMTQLPGPLPAGAWAVIGTHQ